MNSFFVVDKESVMFDYVPNHRGCGDITYLNESPLIAVNYLCVWYISAASVHTDGSAFCYADRSSGIEEQSVFL